MEMEIAAVATTIEPVDVLTGAIAAVRSQDFKLKVTLISNLLVDATGICLFPDSGVYFTALDFELIL